MSFFERLGEDMEYRFLQDFGALDIVLILLLLGVLTLTLFSKKIAEKHKTDEKDVLNLSIKIKTAGLVLAAALALVIMQIS